MDDEVARVDQPDATSERVKAFYERHPYPPPIEALGRSLHLWTDARRRADFHLLWPTTPYRDDFSILVAGCGTSQAARYATRWPHATVTGIDVSATSIEATDRLRRKHDLPNLDLHRLPVERATALGVSFDHIVCTGVLHHLPDPDAGLAALHDVLAPGGTLQLMVYAPYGRAGVYALQDYCRRLGIGTTDDDITDLAATLRSLPPDHPVMPLLRQARDFGDPAGLADAPLHPQDRAYSVPQLMDLLSACGLRFERWLRQAAYLPHCGAPAATPHGRRLTELPLLGQYAAMELFRGSMVRHSLVASLANGPLPRPLAFHGEAWLSYVPMRMPDTVAIQDKLPAAAAAVLVNRNETYTDLYLPIDAAEATILGAIDGTRTIRALVPDPAQHEVARRLFERLWMYDQVVFDASLAG